MKITDNGPKPNAFDIETATVENTNYRTVAWTGKYLQVTLMSIPVGSSIGLEVHPETDQFLRTLGTGRAAAEDLNVLDGETLAHLQAYADGVNAFIATNPDKLPIE